MIKNKKLSKSKVSRKHLFVKSEVLSKQTEEKLLEASNIANDKISRNNLVYTNSNSHSSEYITN